jgi:hypothetical protein
MAEMIYSADPGLIIGFHGCEESLCQAVITGKESLRISNNAWDWLGDGIYFWQNNYDRAWHYANNPPGKLKIDKPAELGAVFSLGNCLDLIDKKFLDIVRGAYDEYIDSFPNQNKKLLVNSSPTGYPASQDKIIRRLDCKVIKLVHEIAYRTGKPPFDSVRALFPEGSQLYPGAGFWEQTHIQVAIRNPNMIKGYFLPRTKMKWLGLPNAA